MRVQPPRVHSAGVVELFSGIDSLYLSARVAPAPRALLADLERLKSTATESRIPAQIDLGPASFEVASAGFGRYRYRLDHPYGILGATDSQSLPTFRIQPRAAFLHAVGPVLAIKWWSEVLDSVASEVRLTASRLDVCADFHGLDFTPEERDYFLCPSPARDEYTRATLSGWVWGAPGAMQRARAYDKVADAKKKGADWVEALWGSQFDRGRSVWRVEAQCKREVLVEYGIDTAEDAIELAPRVYRSVFTKYLTLRVPSGDSNRSRWPLDPRWIEVSEPSFGFGALGLDRVRGGRRTGELRKVMPLIVGGLSTAATVLDARLSDVCGPALMAHVVKYGDTVGKPFEQRCAEKAAQIERTT